MTRNLEIEATNLGPISQANIKLNQISVIGGINGSGKSTLSKLLYCYIAANTLEGNRITNKDIKTLMENFINYWSGSIENEKNPHSYIVFKSLLNDWNEWESSYNYFNKYFGDIHDFIKESKLHDNKECLERLNNIKSVIESTKNPEYKYFNIVSYLLSTEYDLVQLKNYSRANVNFQGTYQEKKFRQSTNFNDEEISINFEGYSDCINFSEILYIDSPSVLDLYSNNHSYHYNHLYNRLTNKKSSIYDDKYNENIIKFEENIKSLLNGEFIFDSIENKFKFNSNETEEILEMKNTSSGYKQLGIIQLLLSNRILTRNSFIIIDEPEINLHQAMQIKYAELLVKLSKELNITLYINSHSPIFIEAMEVFTTKYNLEEVTSFYLAKKSTKKFTFEKIEYENLHRLYDDLGDPYDIINSIRMENITKRIQYGDE